MEAELTIDQMANKWKGSLQSTVAGMLVCFLLTSLSFGIVASGFFDRHIALYLISALALVQAGVQLRLFLHLGEERSPRWGTMMFGSMMITLLIIVAGSLWVMGDLRERTMPEEIMEMHHD